MPHDTDDDRWNAVRQRLRDADGSFWYSVRTTGVFCRPSCAARTPRRENVAFHASAEQAQALGFRPCLRCRPLDQAGTDATTELIAATARYITMHAGERLLLRDLAARAGLSPAHLQRSFKAVLGVSPKQFHQSARLARLKRNLRQGSDVLSSVFDAGFGSTSRVYEQVDGRLGMTPSAYRKGGAGECIRHATRATPLGLLMMAATDRGVCFVQFGEHEELLLAELQREYPCATLEPSESREASPGARSRELDAWMSALAGHLAQRSPRPQLPLDLQGTAFQIRVWNFLMQIPQGAVVSYGELASAIGAPRAVRAAASACAANRIAVLVPCHRVLRGDGALGGYRWGVQRKRALLDAERASRAKEPHDA